MLLNRRNLDEMRCLEDAAGDKARYEACLEQIPNICEMLENPRRDPESGATEPGTCFKWCRLDLCFCNDMRCGAHGETVPDATRKAKPKGKPRRK
jgi:hypothetical protein